MINNSRSEDRRDRTRKSTAALERTAPKPKSRFGKPASRYEVLKQTVKTWIQDRFAVADALKEIRDEKLYQKEYETFEECCESEFGLKHTQAYNLIAAGKIKASLSSAIADNLKNEGQARALASVKESKREIVLKRVVKSGAVTAKAITEATKPRERKGPAVIDVEPEPMKGSAVIVNGEQGSDFIRGAVWACARLVEMFDQPTMAAEILKESGASKADLKLCTEYDLAFLRKESPMIPKGVE